MFYHDHKSRLLQIFITDAIIALEDVWYLWWSLCTLYLHTLEDVRYVWWSLCTLYLHTLEDVRYLWWSLCTLYLHTLEDVRYLWWSLCTLYLHTLEDVRYLWWSLCTLYLHTLEDVRYLWWSLCTLYLHICQVSYHRSFLLCLCDVFWVLINSLVGWLFLLLHYWQCSFCKEKDKWKFWSHQKLKLDSRLLYYLIRKIKTWLNTNHITVHNNTYCLF